MAEPVATLPESARESFKDPLGPVYEDVESLLDGEETGIIAVGDVVTYHLVRAGVTPHVSIVDGRTEREPVSDDVEGGLPDADRDVVVSNPAGTITETLIESLSEALSAEPTTLLRVEGEEDLAALPAVLLAPSGAIVVYGQPGEGMVRVDVTDDRRAHVRELCSVLETTERFWDLLGTESPA